MSTFRQSFLLLMLTVALLIGCQAQQYVSQGDAAMNANRPHEALGNYQRAMASDGSLRSNAEFQAKLREASWRTAYLDAEASSRAGNWEPAIHQYEQTLDYNPAHPTAAQGLARAKAEGAEQKYQAARAAADRNDLRTAREELRKSLTWNPDHANAKAAFDSLDRKGNPASEQRYDVALTRVQQRDWQQAAQELTTLMSIDANQLPARAQLAQANAQMAESRKAYEVAGGLLAENRLDDAIAASQRALDIWPTSAQASAQLQQAQARRSAADDLFTQAKQLTNDGKFDEAITSVNRSLEINPYNAQAKKFAADITQIAAQRHTEEARKQLAAGAIDSAADHFRTALRYVPSYQPAKDGLVDVAYSHGKGAEKEGLWGNALLWYMEAAAQKPTGIYKQAEDRARAAIAKKVEFDLLLSVADSRGNTNPDTTAVATQLVTQARATKPSFVNLVTPDDLAANRGNMPKPLYKAMMTMRAIDIQQKSLGRERKQHSYNEVRNVPNPVLPELENDLNRTERDLAFARGRLIRYDCNDCNRRGHTVCGGCRGQKWSNCNPCNGSGRIRMKNGAYQVCGACNGKPRNTCQTCGGVGHLRCNRCGGRGFFNDYDHNQIRIYERQVIDLRNRLRREPPTIRETYLITVPYEQETYQKTGRMDASVALQDSTGKSVQSFEVSPSFSRLDLVTINAQPQAGLPADGLDLPSDDAVYRSLINDAAKNTITNTLAAATVAQANEYIRQANDHADAGKHDLDIEARVAAIVLLEKTNPPEAKRLLDEIRNPK